MQMSQTAWFCLRMLAVLLCAGEICSASSMLRQQELNDPRPLVLQEEANSHLKINVEPIYPPPARVTNIRGSVSLQLVVSVDGTVKEVTVLSGHPLLVQAALDAVRKRRYEPFLRQGKPVEAVLQIEVQVGPKPSVPVPFPEVRDLKSVVVELGQYSHSLQVTGDGRVLYEGHRACIEGKHSGKISREKLLDLIEAFRKAKYFSLEDQYGGVATDSSPTVISIQIGAQKKSIEDWSQPPEELTRLEEKINQLAGAKKWVECNEESMNSLRTERVNIQDSDENAHYLVSAVERGTAEFIGQLIAAGASTSVKDFDGRTPLMLACRRNDPVIVDLLLRAGAEWQATNNEGDSVLFFAADSGNPSIVRAILDRGVGANSKSQDGSTVLMLAAATGSPKVVQMLLRAGAKETLNAANWKGVTALLAAARGNAARASILMEDEMIRVRYAESDDETDHQGEIVQLLVNAGADVNASDDDGRNALFDSEEAVVRKLIENKIDVNARDKDGETALMDTDYGSVGALLLGAGAEIDAADNERMTALLHAARYHNLDVLRTLVQSGASVNWQDERGMSALMYAAKPQDYEFIETLLKAHCDVNARNKNGLSALGLLRMENNPQGDRRAEQALLAAGATQ
jgi:TonB family protein